MLVLFFEINLSRIPNTYNTKCWIFENGLSKIEVLVLGSSHAKNGINPNYLDGQAFNMASASQSLYYDQQLLVRYLSRMTKLKVVIVDISLFSLETELADGEAFRQFFYTRYYHITPYKQSYVWDVRNYSLFSLYGAMNSLEYAKKGFAVNLAGDIDPKGWDRSYDKFHPQDEISLKAGGEKVKSHLQSMNPRHISDNVTHLKDLIVALEARRIRVVFVTTPVFHTYSDCIPADRYQRTQKVIYDLCRTYGIKYFNHLSDNRFLIADFSDSDHLNASGARKFSQIINNEFVRAYLS